MSKEIDYNKLYEFGEDHSLRGKRFRAAPEDPFAVDEVALSRGEACAGQAIRFDYRMGKCICDVIWTTLLPLTLISKKFRDVLKRESLTGWTTFPAKVYDQVGKEIKGYAGLAVTGRAGPIDNMRSQKFLREPYVEGGPCIPCYRGMYFKDDEWDGSDFCMPQGRTSIIVTQRVKDALKELMIPNVEFRQLSTDERHI